MHLRRCTVSLCDIRSRLLGDSSPFSVFSPRNLSKMVELNTKEGSSIPIDDLCSAPKEKQARLKQEEDDSSGEDSDCEEEDDSSGEDSDNYEEEDDSSGEDSDNYEIYRSEKIKKISNIKSISKHEKSKMSSYEKMIEQKRLERLKLLESLKIKQLKSEFADAVNSMKRKKIPRKIVEKKLMPQRKSSRLAKIEAQDQNFNLNEDTLHEKAWEKAQLENEEVSIPSLPSLPSKLSFTAALGSEDLYKSYIKDINIQKSRSTGDFCYNRSILETLNLEDSHITNIVPGTLSSLSWHPSENNLILAAGSSYGRIGIWNVDSQSSHLFKIHHGHSTHVQFNPFDPNELFSSSNEGTLRCGDMVKHAFDEIYKVSDEASCTHFDFVSSTTYVISLSNGQVALVDRRSRRPCVKRHKCHEYSINSVNVHPVHKSYFLTAETEGTVNLWDLRKLQENPVVGINHTKGVNTAFFSNATGNSILTSSSNNSIRIFDSTNLTENIKVIHRRKCNQLNKFDRIFRATWLPNSDEIFVTSNTKDFPRRIEVFDKNLKPYHSLMHENLKTIISVNVFHPFRPALAGGNTSGRVFVFT